MKKKHGIMLLIIVFMIVLVVVFLNGKKADSPAGADSVAGTESVMGTGPDNSADEILPEDESGSEQVEEYVVELDEDETYEIN